MLFNKDYNGAAELHTLTGLYYAGNDFSAIAPEITAATHVVATMVGKEVIERAEKEYAAANPDMVLLDAIRLPIACLAICNWAKQNLISHEDTGRKMKVDESEKTPFEWMVDRDDRELREKYYRAMDALYSHLEANGDWEHPVLKDSIIKSLAELEWVFPVDGSHYCFYMMLPLFIEVQRTRLKKFLGGEKYEQLFKDHDSGLAYPARRFVVLEALAIAVRRWSLSAFPLMIARRFSPSYQGNKESSAATIQEMEWYLSELAVQSSVAREEMLEELAQGENRWKDVQVIPDNDRRNKFFNVG